MKDLYWDPFDHAIHRDPHPVWARMMEEAPLYRNDVHDFWAVTRFDDVMAAICNPQVFSSSQGDILEMIRSGGPQHDTIITMDPPEQTALRNLLSRAFTPRTIADQEPAVRRFTRELLDEQADATTFDFVEDFGARLPGLVISEMLGVPDADRDEIRRLTDEKLHRDEGELDMERYHRLGAQITDIYAGYVAERRTRPTDDLMSALLSAELSDEHGERRRLTDREALTFISLLSTAGNETTAKFVGWAGATLAKNPDQRAKLVRHPELIPSAVEEILRYEPPSMCLARVVQQDVTMHDVVLPRGAVLVLINAATGRDPRKFDDPNRLDIERTIDRHLSFGFGPHVCLGAALARLEARVVLEETLARYPEWDVDWEHCEFVHTGSSVRGYKNLPIHV